MSLSLIHFTTAMLECVQLNKQAAFELK